MGSLLETLLHELLPGVTTISHWPSLGRSILEPAGIDSAGHGGAAASSSLSQKVLLEPPLTKTWTCKPCINMNPQCPSSIAAGGPSAACRVRRPHKGDPQEPGMWSPERENPGSLEMLGPWTRETHGDPGALQWGPHTGSTPGAPLTPTWAAQRKGTSGIARSPCSPERGDTNAHWSCRRPDRREPLNPKEERPEQGNSWNRNPKPWPDGGGGCKEDEDLLGAPGRPGAETREDKSPQQNLMAEAVLRGSTVQEFSGDKKPRRSHMKWGCKPSSWSHEEERPTLCWDGGQRSRCSSELVIPFMAERSPTSAWNVGRASVHAPASSPTFAFTWMGAPLSRARFEMEY
ncbi:uncharacterized protein LOC135292581 [Passer domesticus]|uniref:uncharacterized protein LOC135292581 n=1 Tax=Passer domesticus TaxID=48849 RepID=UPI0030FE6183